MTEEKVKCAQCRCWRLITQFATLKNGRRSTTCIPCADTARDRRSGEGQRKRAEVQAKLLDQITATPGRSAYDLADILGLSLYAVRNAANALARVDKIDPQDDGKLRRYYPRRVVQATDIDAYLLRGLVLPTVTSSIRHGTTTTPVRSPEPPSRREVQLHTSWARM